MQEVSKVQQHLQLDHLPMMTDEYETACAVDFESEAKDPETLVEPFDAELLETKDSDKERTWTCCFWFVNRFKMWRWNSGWRGQCSE